METSRKIKYSRIDRLILGIAYALLSLFVLSIVIPLIYVVLASFMDPTVLNNQGLSFRIKDWTLDAYRRVLENERIWRGFCNFSDHYVFWWWDDPDIYINQPFTYGEYCMGYFNTRSIQCMEYDSCKNLLPVNTKGTQRGVLH